MKHVSLFSLALASVALGACSSSDETPVTTQEAYDTYVETRQDALSVLSAIDTSAVLTEAPSNDTAQLEGTYAISADSFSNTELVGEITVNVDFGNETISGSTSNNYLDPDGTDESSVVPLDGSLSFSGDIDLEDGFVGTDNTTLSQIDASGSGTLTESNATEVVSTYDVNFGLSGDFYDTSDVGEVAGVGTIGDVAVGGFIEGSVDVTTDDESTLYDINSDTSTYFAYDTVD